MGVRVCKVNFECLKWSQRLRLFRCGVGGVSGRVWSGCASGVVLVLSGGVLVSVGVCLCSGGVRVSGGRFGCLVVCLSGLVCLGVVLWVLVFSGLVFVYEHTKKMCHTK